MIIALKEQSRVYVASDTMHSNTSHTQYNAKKIWQCEPNEVLMGGEGNNHAIEEVKNRTQFIPDTLNDENVASYLFNLKEIYQEQLKSCFSHSWSFLICGSAKIYSIHSSGLITNAEQFEAIGMGREAALSVLEVTAHMAPEPRLNIAMRQVMKYYPHAVGGDIKIEMI